MTDNYTNANISLCSVCKSVIEPSDKFCSNCGTLTHSATVINTDTSQRPQVSIPDFAQVHLNKEPNPKLRDEAYKATVSLAQQRLFLYMHWLIFLGINWLGLWLAFKCYREFNADEFSRIVMASVPFIFINLISLLFIVPIRGTRQEIYKLKSRLHTLQMQMEYSSLH